MITKNKLSDQPENKLTTKFKPIEFEEEDFVVLGGEKDKNKAKHKKENSKRSRAKLMIIFLPILMLVIAGSTFGIMYLVAPKKSDSTETVEPMIDEVEVPSEDIAPEPNPEEEQKVDEFAEAIKPITQAQSNNPTIQYGRLMLINPNFPVENSFIKTRKTELISLQNTYGIKEGNSATNGDNLLDKEAAEWLNKMVADYTIFNPGHTMETRSCFREVGTNCGRMCAATGESDHHSGLTCDLVDPVYGTSLDTNAYERHLEWQWLKQNSYKYGFIDRFPAAWAGGPMSEPANVDAIGSTGLYETWHYRYVGVFAATEIATGVYNDKAYDSLEHYLKMRGLVPDLLNGK